MQRDHAPLECHLLDGVLVMGQPDDRAPRPQPRDRRGRLARRRGDEDRLHTQRLGEVAGRVGHGAPDARLLARIGHLVPVAEARLDCAREPVHVFDRLDGVGADGGLA